MVLLALLVCLVRANGQAPPTPPQADPVAQMKAAVEKQKAAITLQRMAAARQAEVAAKYRWPSPAMTLSSGMVEAAACPPLADSILNPLLESAATRQGVAVDLLRAVARQESAFRPCAVSPKGAKGLMQLMPATAARFSVRDPFNPQESVHAGARYLKELLGRYNGDLQLALAAYNAGPNNVTGGGAVPDIPETRNYVQSILRMLGGTATPDPPPASSATPPDPPAQ